MLILPNLLIKKYIGIQILDNYVLLFTAFLYSSIHMINYHVKQVPTHKSHHKSDNTNDKAVNFGPDVFDIIFDTKKDNEVYEDINQYSEPFEYYELPYILIEIWKNDGCKGRSRHNNKRYTLKEDTRIILQEIMY